MATDREKDAVTGTETTGHEWDGIRELDNPLPKWWLYVMYACILWSVGYYFLYPAIPWLDGHTKGTLGYTERTRLVEDIAEARAAQASYFKQIETSSLAEIRANQNLLDFANAGGRASFAENCAPCHGSGAAGGPGYPNLADDDWLWGGKLENIYATLRHGVRWPQDEDTRVSDMPRFGEEELLTKAQISDVTEYVLSFTDKSEDAAAAGRGKAIYAEQCVACHGPTGDGNMEVGAPRLNDAIWFYGDDKATVAAQIAGPQQGVMPSWQGRLDDVTLKMLTVYVHSLGGGQ